MHFLRRLFVCLSLVSCCAAGNDPGRYADGQRKWTLPDSIGVKYFMQFAKDGGRTGAIPGAVLDSDPQFRPYVLSPDARHLFCVTFNAELSTDSITYELQIFAVEQIARRLAGSARNSTDAVKPLRRLAFTSPAENHESDMDSEVIAKPYWESNSTIVFAGNRDGSHRLYRLNIGSGELTALTPPGYKLSVWFSNGGDYLVQGNSVSFTVNEQSPWRPLDRYPMSAIEKDELEYLSSPMRAIARHYISRDGKTALALPPVARTSSMHGPWVAPNGKWAVAAYVPDGARIPAGWFDYQVKPKKGYRFALIDLDTGAARDIVDAPGGTVMEAGRGRPAAFKAFWSAGSSHVLIYNTALPLNENREERQRMSYMIDLDVAANRWSIVSPMARPNGERVRDARWLAEGRQLLVRYEKDKDTSAPGAVLSFDGSRWQERPATASEEAVGTTLPVLPDGLSVSLEQSFDSPPVLVASKGRRRVALTEPDAALKGVWRAPAQMVEWKEGAGTDVKGVLLLPRGYSKSKPVPLVIQGTASHLNENMFSPDGGVSGYAAQSLVAAGMAVLQLPMCYYDEGTTMLTPAEGPAKVMRVDTAVQELAGRGFIDPARVGLVGFSRCAYTTYYVITHPGKTKLGAAVVIDGVTAGYGEYVLQFAQGDDGASIYDKQYGEGTFWQNKTAWLDAPSFNVEKSVTPALFAYSNNPVAIMEIVGAFRVNQKPFEFLLFSKAGHVFQRPRERAAAMQGTVDWMKFWLQKDDSGLAQTPGRQERWRQIRSDWEKAP